MTDVMEPGCQNDKVLVIVLNIEIQFEFHINARCLVPAGLPGKGEQQDVVRDRVAIGRH